MAIIKISDAFKAGADWISATVRAFHRDQSAIFFDTVQEVRDADLEQARWIFVKANGAFYRLDLSSTAEDDGDTVIRDNIGRRYLKAWTAVVSPDGSAPRIVAMTQAAFDALNPPDASTTYIIIADA